MAGYQLGAFGVFQPGAVLLIGRVAGDSVERAEGQPAFKVAQIGAANGQPFLKMIEGDALSQQLTGVFLKLDRGDAQPGIIP